MPKSRTVCGGSAVVLSTWLGSDTLIVLALKHLADNI